MTDEVQEDSVPAAPENEPGPQSEVDAELEKAVAAFDAHERTRALRPRPTYEPFSLGDVDRRAWIGVGAVAVLGGTLLGGPPWGAGFWIAMIALTLVMAPIVGGAIFLWRRNR